MQNPRIFSKIYIFFILIFSIFLSETSTAASIWINKTGGLTGYELTSLAADKENSNTIYVGAKGLLFKTSDGGESWKDVFKVPGANKAVNFIALHPQNPKIIYIATEAGVFKSIDGGNNWETTSIGVGGDNVRSLLIDTENNNTVFAATRSSIFVTKDGGKNWKRASEGISAINITSFAQNYIDGEILFASAENGLFKSVDGGGKWTKVFSTDFALDEQDFENDSIEETTLSASPNWVSVDPFNPEIIYLSTERGVFKSEDSGNSWGRLPKIGLPGIHIKNLVFPAHEGSFIFATTGKGVFRFSEKENMWQEFYTGLTSKETVFAALNDKQDTLWLAAKNGIYKSKGDIYEIKEVSVADKANDIFQNFTYEPSFREIQEVAIEYAEVYPEKIAKWRRAAKSQAVLPRLSFGIQRDNSKSLHWDAGANPDTWVVGPEDEDTGWDITCTWDLGELIWNPSQTSIDVRSKLMVQLRDDILDEVTRLYFERRRLQIELMQDPPKDIATLIERELRLQELTADIDAMTGGYLSREIERRKSR